MYSNIKLGDLLYRSKGIVEHAGIYVGNSQVLHNQPSEGAVITSFDEFASGKKVKVTSTSATDHSSLAMRLNEMIGSNRQYNPLTNNCEHLASFIIAGRQMSPQVQASAIGSAIGVIIGTNAQKGHWLVWLAGGAIAGLMTYKLSQKYDFIVNPELA